MAAAGPGSRSLKTCLTMIEQKRFLAPNLKVAHLWLHRGQNHSNRVMKDLVCKHLLALRWMNPSALVYLRDSPEKGEAHVEFELWNGRKSGFVVGKKDSPERVVAKLLFAARDPADDPAEFLELMERRAAEGSKPPHLKPSAAATASAAAASDTARV